METSSRFRRSRLAALTLVQLTPLYEWYRGDFEQAAGTVLEYAARYDPALAEALAAGAPPRESFLDYDWSLNAR